MCEPKLLLLDEPISQLDPLAGAAFLETLKKINVELGVTVVMAEHRLEDAAGLSDKIVFMDAGRIVCEGTPGETLRALYKNGNGEYVPQLPSVSLRADGSVALTPKDFREKFPGPEKFKIRIKTEDEKTDAPRKVKPVVRLGDVAVRYADSARPVLNRLNFECFPGEFVCVAGGNGSGKTTLLKLIAGIVKPFEGGARVETKSIGYMPQHVRDYFLADKIKDEILSCGGDYVSRLAEELDVGGILEMHPFDVSGGEQQKVVLLAILSRRPELILLDEPTKGMDPRAKRLLAKMLKTSGAAVVIATHDLEFAAEHADRCAMLFDGEIEYSCGPREFFSGNRYYTTALSKGMRHIDKTVILPRDVFGGENE